MIIVKSVIVDFVTNKNVQHTSYWHRCSNYAEFWWSFKFMRNFEGKYLQFSLHEDSPLRSIFDCIKIISDTMCKNKMNYFTFCLLKLRNFHYFPQLSHFFKNFEMIRIPMLYVTTRIDRNNGEIKILKKRCYQLYVTHNNNDNTMYCSRRNTETNY